jgi:hypothetical protein
MECSSWAEFAAVFSVRGLIAAGQAWPGDRRRNALLFVAKSPPNADGWGNWGVIHLVDDGIIDPAGTFL